MRTSALLTSVLLLAVSSAAAFSPALSFHSKFTPTTSTPRTSTRLFQWSISELEANFIERANQNTPQNMPELVYTLVYNPYTEQEGVHTTDCQGQQAMLVFESIEECNEFAFALGAEPTVPGQPVATPTPLAQIEMACQQMGWALKVVPAANV